MRDIPFHGSAVGEPWSIDVELRPNETLLRHDPVWGRLTVGREQMGRSHMILTNQRVLFRPPPSAEDDRLQRILWSLLNDLFSSFRPIPYRLDLDLTDIRFETWRPFLSGPVLLSTAAYPRAASFQPLTTWTLYPWRFMGWWAQYLASDETRIEQFRDIERAWKAVKNVDSTAG
jgi:hypothetical protein